MLAIDGRCKTLDAAADGYVRAEAAGCILLVPATRAIAAGQEGLVGSCALLAGSAVNQDGRSSSLTAPNGPSQQAVIREGLRSAGLSPAEIGLLEMHGTGTPLGERGPKDRIPSAAVSAHDSGVNQVYACPLHDGANLTFTVH